MSDRTPVDLRRDLLMSDRTPVDVRRDLIDFIFDSQDFIFSLFLHFGEYLIVSGNQIECLPLFFFYIHL